MDNHATPDRGQENVVDMIDVVNRGPRVTGTGYLTRIAQYLARSRAVDCFATMQALEVLAWERARLHSGLAIAEPSPSALFKTLLLVGVILHVEILLGKH